MIMKKCLIFLLTILMCFISVAGCGNNPGGEDISPEETVKIIELDVDNLPILKGDSYSIELTTYENNVILNGVTYEYESENTSVATVSENVLYGVDFGETVINVTVKLGDSVIANKKLQCVVNDNNAIYTNKLAYEVYTFDNVLGTPFKTTDTVYTSLVIDGKMIEKHDYVTWMSNDESVATIDRKGNVTAISEGETYVFGWYRYGDVIVETRKVPVKVSKPCLSTNIDVLFDKSSESSGTFNASQVLGEGYKIGKVVDVDTNREYATTDNAISLNSLSVGDYRFAIHEENEKFITEVNVVVADYVINNLSQFKDVNWFGYSYVALNTDLTDVGVYYKLGDDTSLTFSDATFNGMGHKITGISYRFNSTSIFRSVINSTIKNLAVQCTVKLRSQGGLFVNGYGIVIDNVYIETDFADDADMCGGLCSCAWTPLTVTNTVIKTGNDFTNDGVCGSIMSLAGMSRFSFNNLYVISPLKLSSTISHVSNANYEKVNRTKGVLFKSEEEYLSAIENESVSFDGFNHYWDLSGASPVFKSLK